MTPNHLEVIAAAPDAIALAMGVHPDNMHPLAESLADSPLTSLARADRKSVV